MNDTQEKYDLLLKKIIAINPLLAEAINDVDVTLLEEFASLTFAERMEKSLKAAKRLTEITGNG